MRTSSESPYTGELSAVQARDLAERLMQDALRTAGLPEVFLGEPVEKSHTVCIDQNSMEGRVDSWYRSGSVGIVGVEATLSVETAWWNPHTPARTTVSLSVIEGCETRRILRVSSEAPFEIWYGMQVASPMVPRTWLTTWLAAAGRRLA